MNSWTRPVTTWSGHKSHVLAIAFSSDGKDMALGFQDGVMSIVNIHTKQKQVFRASSSVIALRFSPDGTYLVSESRPYGVNAPCGEHVITLLNRATAKQNILQGQWGSIVLNQRLCFSPDSTRLYVAAARNLVHINVATSDVEKLLQGHTTENLYSVAISRDSKHIASVSDREVCVWDYATGRCLSTAPLPTYMWRGALCTFSTNNHCRLIGVDNEYRWQLVDTTTQKHLSNTDQDGRCLNLWFEFSSDGKYFTTESYTQLKVWSVSTGVCCRTLDLMVLSSSGDRICLKSVAFTPDCCHLATGWGDGCVRMWPLFDAPFVSEYATPLLECAVAPYITVDIVDLLLANAARTCFETESAFLHFQKINLITHLQQSLKNHRNV